MKTKEQASQCGNPVEFCINHYYGNSMLPNVPFVSKRFSGSRGIYLAADVGGNPESESVILLHGGGQTRHSWGSAFETLVRAGYYVINLEARGHGDSDWASDGDYRFQTMAEDLCAVIETLPRLPVLVGASMGGCMSLLAAGTSSTAVCRALIMVDVVPRIEPAGTEKIHKFMSASPEGFASLEEAADAVARFYPSRPRPKDVGGLAKNLREWNGRLFWHWDPKFINRPDRAEPPQFADLLLAACAHVTVPVLLIRGTQSDIVGDSGVTEFRAHLPQLEVFDVTDAGHMVAGDKNDAFNKGVIDFLRRYLPVS